MVTKFWMLLIFVSFAMGSFAGAQVTFVIESLPGATPEKDTLFIAGSFNNWDARNKHFIMQPQANGTYSITLPALSGRAEYKFTRGSWLKVETNDLNEYLPNRVYSPMDGNMVYLRIYNWQDCKPDNRLNFFIFYFGAMGVAALVLLLFSLRIRDRSRLNSLVYAWLNSLLAVGLIGGALYQLCGSVWQSKLALLAYSLLFLWEPVLGYSLNVVRFQRIPAKCWRNYIPFILVLILNLFLLVDDQLLRIFSRSINPYLSIGSSIEIAIGLVIALFYHLKGGNSVLHTNKEEGCDRPEVRMVGIISLISLIALIVLFINFVLLIVQAPWQMLQGFELVFIVVSSVVVAEAYFYWRHPELMRNEPVLEGEEGGKMQSLGHPFKKKDGSLVCQKDRSPHLIIGNFDFLVEQLCKLMDQQKPFKNPDLSIADLSEMLNSKTHILSRLVNEHYNKNFRDFINEYRVREFILLSVSDEYKNYTFLALAYEVGFNSKSTFNLAFKKVTGLSPSDYFKRNFNVIKGLDVNV